jgi:phosphatidylserine/phosphatidylglycerophosphate/cardiolipin synthase-like enzyme
MAAMTRWLKTLLPLLLLVHLVCAGCGSVSQLPPGTAAQGSGHLWQDGAIFDEVRRLLSAPQLREVLWVEMYEFGRQDLMAALVAARDRGADVRLIVDPTVDVSRQAADQLRAAGLSVRLYPVDERRHQIDHVKLLYTDRAALVAGMNWGGHSDANHDYGLVTSSRVELERLRSIFEHDWAFAGGVGDAPVPSRATASIVETTPGEEIRTLLLDDIDRAQHSIDAEVYTLTDGHVLTALAGAHRRGVEVRMVVDPNQQANQRAVDDLRTAGIPVRGYPVPRGTLLHAKAGLFDGRTLLLGSANWTLSGLSVNHELDLETVDPAAAAAFAARFERDWAASA